MLKAFLPLLLERPEAHVVNISSMGGFVPVRMRECGTLLQAPAWDFFAPEQKGSGKQEASTTMVFVNLLKRLMQDKDLEAIYSFPLPKSASLSEMTIWAGEKQLDGEVVEAKEARRVYEEERDAGNDAGLAEKKG